MLFKYRLHHRRQKTDFNGFRRDSGRRAHLIITTGWRKDGPSPRPSPIGWERGKTRWQQGRARPLTPALSPSDGEREKRDCAAAGGTDRARARRLESSRLLTDRKCGKSD